MKIYRVSLEDSTGMSLGFSYHSNRADAFKALKANEKNEGMLSDPDAYIQERDFIISKYEFLKLLKDWASHPDNG